MVGIRLIIVMAIVGGLIAYIADKMGSKIGKRKMTVFGLRPKYTSILLTVLTGIIISVTTIGIMSVASESARTALFGMEKLQEELSFLNSEKDAAGQALEAAKKKVEVQNDKINSLDAKIKESSGTIAQMETRLDQVNSSYLQAKGEVEELTATKESLGNEVQELEKMTETLRKGLITIREGQVFYRAGEVIYAGLMYSGKSNSDNKEQIKWLLQNANEIVLQRLGLAEKAEQSVQVIWIANDTVSKALAVLDKAEHNMLFRVRAVANVVVGELVVCDIEMVENRLIYHNGQLIYSEVFDVAAMSEGGDNLLSAFLARINRTAVEAGVLPDPITGKVGTMDAATMIELADNIRRMSGKFIIKAYAKGDIHTAGPVQLYLRVEQLHE